MIIRMLTLLFFTTIISNASSNDYRLNMKMIISSSDSQKIILNHSGEIDERIEGYYLFPSYKALFNERMVKLQAGGFNFLDHDGFEGITQYIDNKQEEENFLAQDCETITNGRYIKKAISFQMQPVGVNSKSDTLNLVLKYAIYDFIKQKDSEPNYDYNIKLFHKLIRIPFGKEFYAGFIDEVFKNCEMRWCFTKTKKEKEFLTIKNDASLFTEIKKSANESDLANLDFQFDIEFLRYDESSLEHLFPLTKYQEQNLPDFKMIKESRTNEKIKLTAPIYYSRLKFPFILYNTQKEKLYENYKTKKKIFQSTYDIIIVPIKFVNDSLTFDLFINYSKLNLDDDFKRWTPIKKRIVISGQRKEGSILFPKENWSANIIRRGEQYNIYGYTDFERFVNEILYIKINKIIQKKWIKL